MPNKNIFQFIAKDNKIIKFIESHGLLLLFLFCFIVYNSNFRIIHSTDAIPAKLLPFIILQNHNLYFDHFSSYYDDPYFLVFTKGHYLSLFPIVTPILLTPVYLFSYLYIYFNSIPIDLINPQFELIVNIWEKLSASILASATVIIVFMVLREIIDKYIALICSLIFALATANWTISSQTLWQHGLSEFLLALAIYLVIKSYDNNNIKTTMYLGLVSGLFLFNRPPDAILLLPFLYHIVSFKSFKVIANYLSFLILAALPFVIYNYYFFNSLFGGYSRNLGLFILGSQFIFNYIGLLISPNRGLLIYSPILLFSLYGYYILIKNKNYSHRTFFLIMGISIALMMLMYSLFHTWYGGYCFGPRFLTDILPALAIFLGISLDDLQHNMKGSALILVVSLICLCLAWSIFVQLVGAFYYPNGSWDSDPDIDTHRERLWDWKDTQIMRSFHAGFVSPVNFINKFIFIINDNKTLRIDTSVDSTV